MISPAGPEVTAGARGWQGKETQNKTLETESLLDALEDASPALLCLYL